MVNPASMDLHLLIRCSDTGYNDNNNNDKSYFHSVLLLIKVVIGALITIK